ncbi:MAG: CbtA family protein [Rhodospirillales bacterium]|nr:CbtA family protein [Rhodospirillales bacterium]
MIHRLLWAAIIAGLVGGVGVSLFHWKAVVPLILEAEKYEHASGLVDAVDGAGHPQPDGEQAAEFGAVQDAEKGDEAAAWQPDDGLERMGLTVLADIVTGIGFSMLLFGCIALRGRPIDARQGLAWGLAGFATITLAPSVGLPPELPGSAAADLIDRRAWWLATVLATAAGLALVIFGRRVIQRIAGLGLIGIPHIIGAPHPEAAVLSVPAELASKFAVLSLLSAAVLWLLLGGVGGWLYQRWNLGREAA